MFRYEGKHLLIDAVCNHEGALFDIDVGKALLAEMADTIGMTMIMAPTGVQFPHEKGPGIDSNPRPIETAPKGATAGYSAFVMLAESHISLHTFPEAGFLTVDCYSCKDFDHALAIDCLDRAFDLRERNIQVVARRVPTAARLPSTEERSADSEQAIDPA